MLLLLLLLLLLLQSCKIGPLNIPAVAAAAAAS
jgi:hypothetical protein